MNYGADYRWGPAGIQVPPSEMGEFERFLKKLGYPRVEETGNPAYQLFLG
jgi:threonine dehydratase